MADWHIPWPAHFPPPAEWSQAQWAMVLERWMPIARGAIRPRRDGAPIVYYLLSGEVRLPGSMSFDGDLENVLREAIADAILRYSPDIAEFSTFLDDVVRHRVKDRVKVERGQRRRFRVGRAGDNAQHPSHNPEVDMVRDIDWAYGVGCVALRLGAEYGRLARDRFARRPYLSQRDHAAEEGISLATAKRREKKVKEFIRQERLLGREPLLFRQEVLERDGTGTA
jgi:hypothetical protein